MRVEAEPWWRQAQADISVARSSLRPGTYYASTWFVHQGVEKGLKTLFIERRGHQAPHTHDLLYLGRALALLPEQMLHIQSIDPAFKFSRYPDIISLVAPVDGITEATAATLLQAAEEIMTWLRAQLP